MSDLKIYFFGVIFVFLSVLTVHSVRVKLGLPVEISFGTYGSVDFSEYWAATRLWNKGENPYDYKSILKLQKNAGMEEDSPVMMWNPPWIIPFTSLLISESFEKSAYRWFLFNIFICSLSVLLFSLASRVDTLKLILMFLTSIVFIPIHTSLAFGQIGCWLLLGTIIYYLGVSRKLPYIEGIGLIFLSFKPHVLYLLIIFRYIKLMGDASLTYLIKSSILPLVYISGFSLIYKETMADWFKALSSKSNSELAVVQDWIVVSFTGFLRNVVYIFSGNSIPWVMYVVPVVSIVGMLYLHIKGKIPEKPEIYFPYLVAASLFLNPYGWLSDSVCLLIAPLTLISYATRNNFVRISIILVLVQLLFLPFAFIFSDSQHWLFLYPLIIGLVFKILKDRFKFTFNFDLRA